MPLTAGRQGHGIVSKLQFLSVILLCFLHFSLTIKIKTVCVVFSSLHLFSNPRALHKKKAMELKEEEEEEEEDDDKEEEEVGMVDGGPATAG